MCTFHLYNALSQKLEPFAPTNPYDVKIYCSGPFLYDVLSLARIRTYIIWDILRRVLRHNLGYGVRCVMNVTDMDDTLLAKGGLKVARYYEHLFFQIMKQLNVERPDFAPRLTDCVYEANNLRDKCLIQEFAYNEPSLDTTYFNVEAYLNKRGVVFSSNREDAFLQTDLKAGEKTRKRNPRDFALWYSSKKWITAKGNAQQGMPERYLASAAMTRFYFPDSVDIYLGDIDLHYGEYEKEIALIREYSDEEMVHYCVFVQHVQIEGKEMSKTVHELLTEGYSPLAIRYLFLKHPYDTVMTLDKDAMEAAQKSYVHFIFYINRMKTYLQESKPKEIPADFDEIWYDGYGSQVEADTLNEVKRMIDIYLKDNLNVQKALETLEDYVKMFSDPLKTEIPHEWLRYCLDYILWIADSCFGLIPKTSDSLFFTTQKVKDELENLGLISEAEEKERRWWRKKRYVKGE